MRPLHLLVLSACLFAGCATVPIRVAKPTQTDALRSSCEDIAADATFVTYNATIAPGIARQATPRIPYVAEAIGEAEYDVMCVQEAYSEHARLAISDASGLDAAQVFTADTKGVGETGTDRCDADDVSGIRECVEKKCAGEHSEETTKCAISKCKSSLIGLFLFNGSCLNCLAASAGKSIEGIVDTCVMGTGASRLYEGRNGMMLLSKHPMRDRTTVNLPSSGVNRVALLATVDLPSGKSVRVACTQLSTSMSTGPTHPEFDSWAEEQAAQASLVLAEMAKVPADLSRVVMGDLGFSIGSPAVVMIEQDTWRPFEAAGYWSPAMHVEPPMCTGCRGNTVGAYKEYAFLVDHVMFRVADAERFGPVCADTVFADKIRIQGYFGKEIPSHRSAHYGLRVRAIFPPTEPEKDTKK